jgi:F-type H+-transporting ATPase subunit b
MEILHSLGIEWQGVATQVVGFLILIWLLNKFGFKPILAVIDQRQADIKQTYDQLDTDRAAMEETRREYERRLQAIESEAREKIQAAVKEAQELRASMVAEAHQTAQSIVEKGRLESDRERQKAFLEMRQQIVEMAILGAGKVIDETLDQDRHRKLVDDFLTTIGTPQQQTSASNGASSGRAS